MADDLEDLDGTGVLGGEPDAVEGREPIASIPQDEDGDYPINLPDDFPSQSYLGLPGNPGSLFVSPLRFC